MTAGSTHLVAPSGLTMYSLPTENLLAIFSHASTRTLIQLSMVCHRFHAVTFRVLKPRLEAAALREDLKLQLLCTPPGVDSRVRCNYLSIDAPADSQVSKLYARFRPEAYTPKNIPLAPPGRLLLFVMGADDFMFASFGEVNEKDQGVAVRRVALEDFDYFVQLQTKVDLALAQERLYITPSFNIHQNFTRVRREWLEEQTGSNIIWIDEGIGLRVRPHAKGTGQPPNMDYDLDIEELVIRGTRLLVTVDEAAAKQDEADVITL